MQWSDMVRYQGHEAAQKTATWTFITVKISSVATVQIMKLLIYWRFLYCKCYKAPNMRIIVNDELAMMWKEEVLEYSEVLS
jgi:hypothetical protein